MSELKAIDMIVNDDYKTKVYLKSEADKVIAELKAERDEYRYNLSCARNEIHNMQAPMRDDIKTIAKMNGYIHHLEEERRWRKFPEEKPTEEMEGMDFIVSNGFFHREISEWRGYWNNDPFCSDRHCDEVKYWRPLPAEPEVEK